MNTAMTKQVSKIDGIMRSKVLNLDNVDILESISNTEEGINTLLESGLFSNDKEELIMLKWI